MKLTPYQELAVSSRGGGRLVSAAAGSGKTSVLVERLMRWVDDGRNIDEFLVVTYTRAAAGELRSRILSALNQRVAARPADRRLRRQTELCRVTADDILHSVNSVYPPLAVGQVEAFEVKPFVEIDHAHGEHISVLQIVFDMLFTLIILAIFKVDFSPFTDQAVYLVQVL